MCVCVLRYRMLSVGHSVVGMCYQEVKESEICEMFECIKFVCKTNRFVLLMGDFNCRDINWTTLKVNNNGDKFLKLVMDCYLEQHVSLPTRANNILDLILTTNCLLRMVFAF